MRREDPATPTQHGLPQRPESMAQQLMEDWPISRGPPLPDPFIPAMREQSAPIRKSALSPPTPDLHLPMDSQDQPWLPTPVRKPQVILDDFLASSPKRRLVLKGSTTETVCLLARIPHLTNIQPTPMVTEVGVFNSLLVSMIVSANYYFPVRGLKGIANNLYEFWHSIESGVMRFLWKFYAPIDRIERAYFKLKNLCVMFNQICFFMICDNVLVPGQKVTCLYTLMFYNVLAYCVAYIKELVEKEDWSPYVHITDRSNIRHLAMSATKIVLEWTKAVTFIITIVFMLLVFGLETGLENYKPSVAYTIVTFLYYLLTEKVFVEMLTMLINYSQIAVLENMESLWLPVMFQLATAGASSLLLVPLIIWGPYRPALAGLYVNVYLRLKDSYTSNLKELTSERTLIAPYRFATPDELGSFDDVCAVCLNPMKLARITPCHHIFHGDCLRKWVGTIHYLLTEPSQPKIVAARGANVS
ncbi:hypothetical protein GE061_000808 [Apolygus lucorum]|uniref:RING-type domain-containing protein n=1 Tax=Apolygus lucorum TaxID=248454 RepID=A0A8S9Y800_APOLU|nr:hypothetical protein GE061_000808 [Apolygus lucorum]